MAIVNRSLDVSEQRKVFKYSDKLMATGVTAPICVVPWPSTIDGAMLAAFGLSGSPTYQVFVNRFIVGTGFTTWALTGAEVPSAFGTSGVLARGMSMVASGSTLLNLQANDLLTVTSAVANTASTVSVAVVLKPIQDIKYNFGLSI